MFSALRDLVVAVLQEPTFTRSQRLGKVRTRGTKSLAEGGLNGGGGFLSTIHVPQQSVEGGNVESNRFAPPLPHALPLSTGLQMRESMRMGHAPANKFVVPANGPVPKRRLGLGRGKRRYGLQGDRRVCVWACAKCRCPATGVFFMQSGLVCVCVWWCGGIQSSAALG